MKKETKKLGTVNDELGTRKTATPFFSIIVPVYNVAPYLRECLDSVLAQTYPNWECLCVDDGSSDESGAILDEYAQKDARFRVFHKTNGGVSSARNLALDNAKGEWVVFLDGDDVFEKNILMWSFEHISNSEGSVIDLLGFRHKEFDSHLEISQDDQKMECVEVMPLDYNLWLLPFWTCIYRASIATSMRFSSFIIGEDRLYYFSCLFQTNQVICGNYIGYGYRQRNGSATSSWKHNKKVEDELLVYFEIIRLLSKHKIQITQSIRVELEYKIFNRVPQWLMLIEDECVRNRLKGRWYMLLCEVARERQLFSVRQRSLFWIVGKLKSSILDKMVSVSYGVYVRWHMVRSIVGRCIRVFLKA